jgi:hypothetical protein
MRQALGAVALLVFFPTATRAGVVAPDFGLGPVHRLLLEQKVGIRRVVVMPVVMPMFMPVVTVGAMDVTRGGRARSWRVIG